MEAEGAEGAPGGTEAALSCFSFNQDCTANDQEATYPRSQSSLIPAQPSLGACLPAGLSGTFPLPPVRLQEAHSARRNSSWESRNAVPSPGCPLAS